MSDKPSAAWYLAPIFLGIIGSAIISFVLKDEDHPNSPKMVKKGWIIGIALTVISFAWIPLMLIPFLFIGSVDQQETMQPIPELVERMIPEPTPQVITEPNPQQTPTLDDFKNILSESSDIETIFSKFGEPDADIGSGIHIYVYDLNDSTQIWIGYVETILYIHHVDANENILENLL